jgi:hypothetical protein
MRIFSRRKEQIPGLGVGHGRFGGDEKLLLLRVDRPDVDPHLLPLFPGPEARDEVEESAPVR